MFDMKIERDTCMSPGWGVMHEIFTQTLPDVVLICCQNPNLTTTQPNLNLRLGLTRLLLFTPTPPQTLLLLKIKVQEI